MVVLGMVIAIVLIVASLFGGAYIEKKLNWPIK